MPAKEERRLPLMPLALTAGFLSLLLGALLGLVSLATQPVREVTVMPAPEEQEPGLIYYVKGREVGGQQWRAKQAAFKQQQVGVYPLTEGDLNQWARNTIRVATPGRDDETGPGLVVPSAPNFRLVDDRLQISTYVEIPLVGSQRFVYCVTGRLESDGSGVTFVAEEGHLNRAPIARIPLLGGLVQSLVEGAFATAPEAIALQEAFARVTQAEVTPEGVRLTLE